MSRYDTVDWITFWFNSQMSLWKTDNHKKPVMSIKIGQINEKTALALNKLTM